MVSTPLKITFKISSEQLADSKESADKKPIKLIVQRRVERSEEGTSQLPAEPPLLNRDEDDLLTLSLLVEAKAGSSYRLDDGIMPPSNGVVSDEGILVHPVSPLSTKGQLFFAGEATPIELRFDRAANDKAPLDEYLDEYSSSPEEEIESYLNSLADDDEDNQKTLSLLVAERANQAYRLDDGIVLPSGGRIDEAGWLTHPISPQSIGGTLTFTDDGKVVELTFML